MGYNKLASGIQISLLNSYKPAPTSNSHACSLSLSVYVARHIIYDNCLVCGSDEEDFNETEKDLGDRKKAKKKMLRLYKHKPEKSSERLEFKFSDVRAFQVSLSLSCTSL